VRLWEPDTNREIAGFPGQPPYRFNPSGRLLAFVREPGVRLWDVAAGRETTFRAEGRPAGFLTADELIVRDGGRLRVWNIQTDQQVFETPDGWLPIQAINPKTGRLAAMRQCDGKSGFAAGPVAVWDMASRRRLVEIPDVGRVDYAASLPLAEAAGLIAVSDAKDARLIRLFDLARDKQCGSLFIPEGTGWGFSYGRFSPDGGVLAAQETNAGNQSVRLWDVTTGVSLGYLHDHDNPVWSPDGRYLAAFGPGRFPSSGGSRDAVNVYETAAGPPTYRAPSPIQVLALGAAGRELAAQGNVWRVVERGGRRRLDAIETADAPGSLSASGGRLWAMQAAPRYPAKISQLFPEKQETTLTWLKRTESDGLRNFAVSPDGKLLLLAWMYPIPVADHPGCYLLDTTLELHDLVGRKRAAVLDKNGGDWPLLLFSPDGHRAATNAYSRQLAIWDVKTGKVLHAISIQTELSAVEARAHTVRRGVFSPDGDLLYTASDEGRFDVIDVDSGTIRQTWHEPQATASALALSPDGRTLASAGEDRMIHLWDSATGLELARWTAHTSSVTALAFHPDGNLLVSGSADGTLKLWDLPYIRKELTAIGLDW
jgi:WD40 repeat protein